MVKTKAYTVEQAAAKLDICKDYLEDDLSGLRRVFGKRKRMGVVELVHENAVQPKDIVWVAKQLLTTDQRKEFADACTDREVERHALRCGVPAVEDWARRWLSGEDRTARAAWAAGAASVVGAASRADERAWQIRWLKRAVKRWGYERVT